MSRLPAAVIRHGLLLTITMSVLTLQAPAAEAPTGRLLWALRDLRRHLLHLSGAALNAEVNTVRGPESGMVFQ